ncbi:MAG: phosphatase PAP2 family protein [Pedobacter sp.]|nr:phosphatase PAP2 family protein [Pedobacter sp.]
MSQRVTEAGISETSDPILYKGLLALLLTWPLPLLSEYSGLDVWLEDFFFDMASASFPWRQRYWFEALSHGGLRTLLMLLVALNILALLLALLAPETLRPILSRRWRQPRLLAYLLLASLSGPLIVGLLKQTTARSCPWDLARYGGQLPYHDLWAEPLFNLAEPGRCFPGGHSSGGFALLALVPLLQGRRRCQAAAFALMLGVLMGWSRMMQGAHFLSHNLWSAWVCWAMVILCYAIIRPDTGAAAT